MDPNVIEIIKLIAGIVPVIALIVALGVGGSLLSRLTRNRLGNSSGHLD